MKITKEQLERAIFVDKLSYKQIAEKFQIGRSTVDWYITRYGITTPRQLKHKPTKEELYTLYFEKNLSKREILKRYQMGRTTLEKLFNEYGLEFRPIGTNQGHHWTYKEVKELFENIGYQLLEKEYKNSSTPMKYKCDKGHIGEIRLQVIARGGRCKQCAAEETAAKKRHTLEQVRKIFEERGAKLISTEYKNARTPLEFVCPKCGEKAKMSLSNFRKGYGCSNCRRLQFSGANNPHYNPNLSDYDRQGLGRYEAGYAAFRRKVFARDKVCVVCGSKKDKRVHHLEGYSNNPDLRTDANNAVTLCEECHKLFHSLYGYGENNRKQFEDFKKTFRK